MAGPLFVTAEVPEARCRAVAGHDVVLIVDAAASASTARALAALGPGRVHLFVGDVAEPAVRQAADEMAAELGARRGGP
jgi:hypothetical protein